MPLKKNYCLAKENALGNFGGAFVLLWNRADMHDEEAAKLAGIVGEAPHLVLCDSASMMDDDADDVDDVDDADGVDDADDADVVYLVNAARRMSLWDNNEVRRMRSIDMLVSIS